MIFFECLDNQVFSGISWESMRRMRSLKVSQSSTGEYEVAKLTTRSQGEFQRRTFRSRGEFQRRIFDQSISILEFVGV